jgi:hypothetical protein
MNSDRVVWHGSKVFMQQCMTIKMTMNMTMKMTTVLAGEGPCGDATAPQNTGTASRGSGLEGSTHVGRTGRTHLDG